jgi:GNAT superfamily N-acetyltransferase
MERIESGDGDYILALQAIQCLMRWWPRPPTICTSIMLRAIAQNHGEADLSIQIETPANPAWTDREAILQPLVAYNAAAAGPIHYEPLAIMLRDDDGTVVGGLWGHLYYDWLFIELLFVPESVRGQRFGTRLLTQAEAMAREKRCIGIWLDSFSFQAPGFYLKHGFEAWGTLENYPHGHRRVFLRKRLNG